MLTEAIQQCVLPDVLTEPTERDHSGRDGGDQLLPFFLSFLFVWLSAIMNQVSAERASERANGLEKRHENQQQQSASHSAAAADRVV